MSALTETPKQVLVGTNHLIQVGGSELYTYDLLKELNRREDVEVEYFALEIGEMADRIEEEVGVTFMSKNHYDLMLVSHNTTVKALSHFKEGLITQVCHSATVELEQPSPYADYHVGITEEVCESLSKKGYPNDLVLNGIDVDQKCPMKEVNKDLKVVLSLCQSDDANELLANVCDKQGVEFVHFNKHKNPTFNIENKINEADLVVGIGRSVYDAMACGRPCIVFDNRNYNGNRADGYLEPELFEEFVQTNCSGRYHNLTFTEDDLMREFERFKPQDGEKLRQIAEEKLDVRTTTEQLLQTPNRINWKMRWRKSARAFFNSNLNSSSVV
ncbi:hypothetical protein JHJ32_01460 [Parapedobacter sp. ISTM3]|uniref:hypothetical protein n=1 Tax=Parapedobacter sp. ISTM3 TaxID=2800130 RepID=UPI001906F1E4|nr:hypothetical protein [Parapedobacter sp. ISTM3]MBK1438643.1 hypothetical protein [Parapedobacter sp. ISTM3]